MKDPWKEQRVIENAVDKVFAMAKRQANPYEYLYHNPRSIHTMQYFAKWTQRWAQHKAYMVLVRASHVMGYEPVPSELLYRHAKRDGFAGRSVRVGQLVFYLIKPDEMSAGLKRRYERFKTILLKDLKKEVEEYYDEKAKIKG